MPNLFNMRILIHQAKIYCKSSPFHLQTMDLLIQDGNIVRIAANISVDVDKMVTGEGLCVSTGWFDAFADFAEPGYGNRETLISGARAAAAGGFTDVMLMPDTSPPIHNRSIVEFVRSQKLPIQVYPLGRFLDEKGRLTEMYDMREGGALSFTNGNRPVLSAGLMLKVLQYTLPMQIPVILVPGETQMLSDGLMHEGTMSTRLGLAGIPAMAEELMIMRDIELVKYTHSPVHFTGVSTDKGLQLIQAAKAEGLPVTCSVAAYHTVFTDEDLATYDTQLKVFPPLRTIADRDAVRAAVLSGLADSVASHHIPRHTDEKLCEFNHAEPGMSTIQQVFSALRSWTNDIETLIERLTASRHIFTGHTLTIEEGAPARLTMFYPYENYTFTAEMNRSLSTNNPFLNKTLTGKVAGIITENQILSAL